MPSYVEFCDRCIPIVGKDNHMLTKQLPRPQARVTTKYNIKPVKPRATKAKEHDGDDTPMTDALATNKPPRASLIIKTYDPHSGVCLKYKTTKAAEVSRLVQLLGSLGRKMAALPDALAPVVEDDAAAGTATPPVGPAGGAAGGAGQPAQQAQAGAGGGGKNKKKKGKR